MSGVLTPINLSNTTPAAPLGHMNVGWQADSNDPKNVSASVAPATSSTPGIVQPDNTTISISSGVISAVGGGGSGSFTLIQDTLLSSPVSSISFASIPNTFKHLKIDWMGAASSASGNTSVVVTINSDTGGNYQAQSTGVTNGASYANDQINVYPVNCGTISAANARANSAGVGEITIPNYASTSFLKYLMANSLAGVDTSFTNFYINGQQYWISWANTAAISQLVFSLADGSNFVTGTRFTLYGLS